VALDACVVKISLLVTAAVLQRIVYSNISLPTILVTVFPPLSGQVNGSAVATSLTGLEGGDGAPPRLALTVGRIVPVVRGSNVEVFAEAEVPSVSEEFEAVVEVWPTVWSIR
jgi:hypothetical protein